MRRLEEIKPIPVGEIGEGPLVPAPGTATSRLLRRARGAALELLGFLLITILSPLLFLGALVVDLYLKARTGKPLVGVRLLAFIWCFLLTELVALILLTGIWLRSGGPFGVGSMSRRRGVYWLRPRWARAHLVAFRTLFGVGVEIEGLEEASPGPVIVCIRHASIVDNLLGDNTLALRGGYGLRYVVKRELEVLPAIDIGGRWIPTNFLNRADAELDKLVLLTEDLGPAEAITIYPEGTRATARKIARAKEIVRERQPEVAPLAEPLVNLLPPRLGGPLALLESAPDLDVVFYAHVGFDGYEYISDIWAGGLVGSTIRCKLWRVPASEIPRQQGERAMTEWLYGEWHRMDRWVTGALEDLGGPTAPEKAADRVGSPG